MCISIANHTHINMQCLYNVYIIWIEKISSKILIFCTSLCGGIAETPLYPKLHIVQLEKFKRKKKVSSMISKLINSILVTIISF